MRALGFGSGLAFESNAAWSPRSIDGICYWYRAADAYLIGGAASYVPNRAGDFGNLVAEATRRPGYMYPGTPNGGAALTFDGIGQIMQVSGTLVQTWHLFLAGAVWPKASAVAYFVDGGPVGGGGQQSTLYLLANGSNMKAAAGSSMNGVNITAGQWCVLDQVWSGAASKMGLNGGTQITGSAGTNPANGLSIGGYKTLTGFAVMYASTVVAYRNELSSGDRTKLVSYLMGYIGI